MKTFSTIILLLLTIVSGFSQITTGAISGSSFCAGDNSVVSFTVTGTFNPGNAFTAQLSDANGNFSTFTNIGSVSGTTSGSINSVIPSSVSAGNAYRVRVIASNPYTAGSDNGANITVNPLPTVNFSISPKNYYGMESRVLTGMNLTFTNTSSGGNCSWNFGAGATPAIFAGCTPPAVQYNSAGVKNITLTVTSASGCVNSATKDQDYNSVQVFSCSPSIPSDAVVVKTNTTISGGGLNFIWVCAGATCNFGGGGGNTIYLESGATFISGGGGYEEVYLKAGASYSSGAGGSRMAIYEPGASIGSIFGLQCSSLQFDYTNAPSGGCVSTTGINENDPGNSYILYPNPANGKFTIKNEGITIEKCEAEIYNVFGEKVYSLINPLINQSAVIDISSQPNGVYFLNIKTEKELFTQKLIIQK